VGTLLASLEQHRAAARDGRGPEKLARYRLGGAIDSARYRLGGGIDSAAATKAARFIEITIAFHLPMVMLADNPGSCPAARPNAPASCGPAPGCSPPSTGAACRSCT
jgi:hypothetical protein